MAEPKELLLVDLDDTLFFTDECVRLASMEVTGRGLGKEEVRGLPDEVKDRVYGIAQSKYADRSRLNGRMAELLARNEGSDVVILTARTAKSLKETEGLLSRGSIRYDGLIIREDYRIKDEVWKLSVLEDLRKSYAKVKVFEDKTDTLAYLSGKTRGDDGIELYSVSEKGIARFG